MNVFSKKSIDTRRMQWLDALKGIGILLVIFSHTGLNVPGLEYLTAGYMQMFFIASGLVCTFHRSTNDFIGNKAKRLLIPYFIYGIVILLCFCVIGGAEFVKGMMGLLYGKCSLLNYPGFSDSIALPKGTTPLWFLLAMFTAYIIALVINKKQENRLLLLGFIVLQVGLASQPYLLPWTLDLSIYFAFCILIGKYYKFFFLAERRVPVFLIALVLYFVLTKINGSVNLSIREMGDYGLISLILSFLIGFLYTFLVAFICRKFEKTAILKILSVIGRQSLRLMCIHYPIMVLVTDLLWHLHIQLDTSLVFVIQLVSIGLVTMAVSYSIKALSPKFNYLKYL